LKKLKVVQQLKDYLSVPPMKFWFTMSNNFSHFFLVILVVVFLCKSSNQLILFKKVYLAHWFSFLVLQLFLIVIPIFFLLQRLQL
jgi:hypothetical protein